MSQCTRLAHRILRQRKPRLIRNNIKGENAAVRAIVLCNTIYQRPILPAGTRKYRTRFVPLWSVQIESPMSTLSPSENGNELPFAMADATADLRKSILCRMLRGPLVQACLGCPEWVVGKGPRRGREVRTRKRMRGRGATGVGDSRLGVCDCEC